MILYFIINVGVFFTLYKYQPNNRFNCYLFWLMRGKKMIERTEKKMQNPGLVSKRFKRVDLAYILEQIKLLVWLQTESFISIYFHSIYFCL